MHFSLLKDTRACMTAVDNGKTVCGIDGGDTGKTQITKRK